MSAAATTAAKTAYNAPLTTTSSFNYHDQYIKLLDRVKTLAKKMGLNSCSVPHIKSFNEAPSHLSSRSDKSIKAVDVILVPFQFLIDPSSIPEDLRLESLKDKRTRDPLFRKKATAWVNQKINEKKRKHKIKPATEDEVTRFLMSASKPDLYKKSIDFVLARQLAHARHAQDMESPWRRCAYNISVFWKKIAHTAIYSGLLGGGIGVLGQAITVLATTSTLLPYQIAIGLTYLAIAGLIQQKNGHLLFISPRVEKEKKADIRAVTALNGDISGAEYYFNNERAFNLQHRAQGARGFDVAGNDFSSDEGRPLLTERIAYLRAWKARESNSIFATSRKGG